MPQVNESEAKLTELVAKVEACLHALYIADEEAGLRREDRRKARQVAAVLLETELLLQRFSIRSHLIVVDAAAGKSYLGLLIAKLLLEPQNRAATVVTIEKDPRRVLLSRQAAERLSTSVPVECRMGDVAEPHSWPDQPSIVVALHACGPAADSIIEQTTAHSAGALLLVPCCTSKAVSLSAHAHEMARQLAIPHSAPIRRRFIQLCVDAERTWRLEAAGYETRVVEFVSPRVTPHNLLWRAHRTGEAGRTAAARQKYQSFLGLSQRPRAPR